MKLKIIFCWFSRRSGRVGCQVSLNRKTRPAATPSLSRKSLEILGNLLRIRMIIGWCGPVRCKLKDQMCHRILLIDYINPHHATLAKRSTSYWEIRMATINFWVRWWMRSHWSIRRVRSRIRRSRMVGRLTRQIKIWTMHPVLHSIWRIKLSNESPKWAWLPRTTAQTPVEAGIMKFWKC